ncbi:MAG: flagellar hook capping FlgD N-terminal domain-containing protein [Paracoccaceae bacterium]
MIEATNSSAIQPAGQSQNRQTTALTSDFDTFLKMLTAQAKYQDPLEPLDSTEYAAQLAQFSMVEQQVKTNENLETLNANLTADAVSGLSQWINTEVKAPIPANFDGAPIKFEVVNVPVNHDGVLNILNSNGNIIRKVPVSPLDDKITWAGFDDDGGVVPPGIYSARLDVFDEEALIDSHLAQHFAKVTEARLENGEVFLNFGGGVTVPASQVSAIRASKQ